MTDGSAARQIDEKIGSLGDWRGEMLARVRKLIYEADPNVVEQVKWRKPSNPLGVPTWEHAGIVCTGETYKDKVKLTFARGASLPDPSNLFNSSLDGGTRRAIDIREGESIDESAFKSLVRAAVAEVTGRTDESSRNLTIVLHRINCSFNPLALKGNRGEPDS